MVKHYRFVFLFASLLAFMVLLPLGEELREWVHILPVAPGASILLPVLTLVVFSIVRTSAARMITLLVALTTAGLWVVIPGEPSLAVRIAQHLSGLLFLAHAIARILIYLFANRRVTFDLICASLCVYLLLGVLWAVGYSLMMHVTPEAFVVADKTNPNEMQIDGGNMAEVLYFSFATLTTLGYGDIVPKSPLTRMLTTLEALVGQLYLTVLVARLVGMHIADAGRDEELPSV